MENLEKMEKITLCSLCGNLKNLQTNLLSILYCFEYIKIKRKMVLINLWRKGGKCVKKLTFNVLYFLNFRFVLWINVCDVFLFEGYLGLKITRMSSR